MSKRILKNKSLKKLFDDWYADLLKYDFSAEDLLIKYAEEELEKEKYKILEVE